MSKEFTQDFPPQLLNDKLRAEALDVEFHWINETGKEALLTGGAVIKPTVSPRSHKYTCGDP